MIKGYFEKAEIDRKVFVLFGLGGAGKTQTALKSAEILAPRQVTKHQLLEGVLFIDGSSRQNIEAGLSAFATSKHIGNMYADALRWLGSRNLSWLVLFDNVDNPAIRIHEYFPRGRRYSIIITTRHLEVAGLAQDNCAQYSISELEPKDALRLLLRAAGLSPDGLQDSEMAAATVLLKKLGYLVLAITQCGAYVRRNRCSIEQYYSMFLEEPQEMLGVNETATVETRGYARSVHLTWELSYKQVGIPSKRVLGLASFLHRDHISENIFRRAYSNMEKYQPAVPPTDAEVHAQNEVKSILQLFVDKKGNWSSRMFLEAMGELVCLSLVTFDTIGHVYRLHPLVQEWTRALATETSAAIERSAFLLAVSIDKGTHSEDHAFRRSVVPHVTEILGLCPAVNPNNAWQFIGPYNEVRQVDKFEQLELQVLETRTRVLGQDDPATLEASSFVAGTHAIQGRFERAADVYSDVLAAQQRVLGIDHIDTLTTMRELGWTYHLQGRFAEAEVLQAKTLAARKRLLGDDHPDTLLSMVDLSATYGDLGRLAEAEAGNKAALCAYKRVLGGDHPHTLEIMSNLAVVYCGQGRYAEAETIQLETLATRRLVLGDDHPDTLINREALALTYCEQGRLAEAEVLLVEVLAGRTQVLGDSHPETINAMRSLAWTFSAQGRQAEYEELMTQADAISIDH